MVTQLFHKYHYKLFNLRELGLFRGISGGFEVFLKVPVIIIIRFDKIMCLGQYVYIFIDFGDGWRGKHGFPFIFNFLFIKMKKNV